MLLNNKFPFSNVMKKVMKKLILEKFCEYAHWVGEDPVPNSDFTVLHCLDTGLPVYGIKSESICLKFGQCQTIWMLNTDCERRSHLSTKYKKRLFPE
jgi:hypothetical protein